MGRRPGNQALGVSVIRHKGAWALRESDYTSREEKSLKGGISLIFSFPPRSGEGYRFKVEGCRR
jgi:hypothetical protein